MSPIPLGSSIPDGTLAYFDADDQLQQVSIHSLAAGKKIVLFGVPGAFTPNCRRSSHPGPALILKHVPGFIERAEGFTSKGVNDLVFTIQLNNPFVMKAWSKTFPDNKHVKFLADGSTAYTHALGLQLDLGDKGLGSRSKSRLPTSNLEESSQSPAPRTFLKLYEKKENTSP
uniref:Glutaredoxin-dependent peroxiredoxin n=1 Tax=Kalanchoe fedtschenkoi TaxID=63787 RepID=A0A7N0T216_KALFE